ncbi:MAG: hypothetical protein IH987_09455, partial [Planctomycetes bacterium]|nr:hypothetical protein [Planctomycetota bacterium]
MQMMRSLFTVVLLSASGIAAHTAYGQQCSNPPAKPDLVINGISLEGYDHELVVRFINAGTAWADPVRLLVFVDGQELFNQNIFNWLSQESIVATGIHLLGGQRHIVVRVDSDDTEDEENELNNVLSTTLNVVRRDGFDLTVDALIDEQTDLLSVVVGNRGNAPTNGGESITIRVEDVTTGAVFLGWVNATLNLLLPGETQTIPTSIVIVPEADTRVAFWTMPADDLDNTNDAVVRRHMAASAVNTLYDDYLNVNPNVEAAIEWYPLWVDPQNPAPDPIPFVDWATQLPDMETRLRELLLDVEQGRPLPFANDLPQALPDSNSLTEDEAEELYLGILAHTLWFEVRGNDVLPGKNWSLAALDAEQLGMTSLRSRLSIRSSNPSHNPPGFNILHPLNGRVLYDFMSQTGILDADEAQTVWNLVGWTRSHMAHSNGIGYSARFTGESKAFPPAEEPLYVSNGCGGMNGFIYSLLPLLGIPVDGRGTELAVSGSGPWLPHSAFILPTIRKTPADDPGIAVSHSDNININGYPSFGLSFVPPNEIFFSITEYECLKAFFPDICPGECDASPPVGCTQNPACSQGTQPCELRNSYNGRRAWTLRGKEHLSGEWVHRYYDPNQGPIVAEDYMTCPNGNLTQCYVDDLLTQDERTDFLADLDAASCEYGNSSDPMTWNTIDRLKQIHFGGSRFTFLVDCNENGVSDDDDIGGGTSTDSNANGVPDECEPDCGSNCDDGNDCTDDTCTGICLNTIDDTNMCSDGQFCTTGESCTAGVCGGGSATDCSALDDQCSVGVCNEATSACEAQPINEGLSCDDDYACTEIDVCASGSCVGSTIPGCKICSTTPGCFNGNACTD